MDRANAVRDRPLHGVDPAVDATLTAQRIVAVEACVQVPACVVVHHREDVDEVLVGRMFDPGSVESASAPVEFGIHDPGVVGVVHVVEVLEQAAVGEAVKIGRAHV